MDKTQFASDEVIAHMQELQSQNAELTRKLAAYEAMPVVAWIVRMKSGNVLTVCNTKDYAIAYQKAGNFPDLTEVCDCVISKPTTEHLDALLQEAEQRGMEKAAQICDALWNYGILTVITKERREANAGDCSGYIREAMLSAAKEKENASHNDPS